MTIYDLLFLAVVFASVATILFIAGCALVRRRARAIRALKVYAVCAAIYFGIVILVSLVAPRQVVKTGEPLCFDDWCIRVDNVEQATSPTDVTYTVKMHLFSRARRITQRENNLAIYITDSRGGRYEPSRRAADAPLSVQLGPGESVAAERVFKVPLDEAEPGLVIAHEGGFPIGWFIIGQGPFRKAPIVWLPSPSSPLSSGEDATQTQHRDGGITPLRK